MLKNFSYKSVLMLIALACLLTYKFIPYGYVMGTFGVLVTVGLVIAIAFAVVTLINSFVDSFQKGE